MEAFDERKQELCRRLDRYQREIALSTSDRELDSILDSMLIHLDMVKYNSWVKECGYLMRKVKHGID